MIRLAGVSYWYPGSRRPALAGVSLEVGEGAVVGVVGPGESGKSTLCLVAAGFAPRLVGGRLEGICEVPAGGALLLDSQSAQLSGLHDTVYDEVAFGPCNLGRPAEEVHSRTTEALDALGIGRLAERNPARLSGGEKQLVALAGLLAMRPPHLILDEPLGRLDEEGVRLVAEALDRLRRQGTGMMIAEHDSGFLSRLGARVIEL